MYKAIIVDLEICKTLEDNNVRVFSDSQLVINQVKEDFKAKGSQIVNTQLRLKKPLLTSYILRQLS